MVLGNCVTLVVFQQIINQIFDRPEEMGIEEDNIRKHTTPAYRAPEVGLFFYSFSKRKN